MKHDAILVVDFGGQYCHLIARRVRENGVYSEIVPNDVTPADIEKLKGNFNIKGIILSGGPASIYEKGAPKMDKHILDTKIPILGLCYGHQLIAQYLDGDVKPAEKQEFGLAHAEIIKSEGLFEGLDKREQVWMSHGDTVFSMPKGIDIIASTENCPVAAFADSKTHIYGMQWHPEVLHTKHGDLVIKNFVFDICKCNTNWKISSLIVGYEKEIKEKVGDKKAVIALSGGIDSMTTTVLASKAIGKNLTAVFVDNGFMRAGESEQVREMVKKLGVTYVHVDARKRFLDKLKGITSPEEKRKIIGNEFIKVFEEVAKEISADYLMQGTIYPDRIESGKSKNAAVIKTHHNVGGLPTRIAFKGLVEPLRELYKDEVRKVATELGMPKQMVMRQPFPGPGLAVRIMGEITEDKLEILRKADLIVTGEIEKAGIADTQYQYFAILTDTKSTGVKGDTRAYGYTVAVRAIESTDVMTAEFSKLPYELLEHISTRITNEIKEVSRVVYDITNKPPATIEWE